MTATYAGDVGPAEAYAAVRSQAAARLVDCRTRAEWQYVGVPEVEGDRPVFVEWQRPPDGARNAGFLEDLADAGVDPQAPVYFLCRSGARSRAAAIAATAAGYAAAFNVAGGFEGPAGPDRHRGTVAGWKFENLPWSQA